MSVADAKAHIRKAAHDQFDQFTNRWRQAK